MNHWIERIGGAEIKVMRLHDKPAENEELHSAVPTVDYIRRNIITSLRYNTDTENLMVVHLNVHSRPIRFEVISNGTLDTLLVHAREIFRSAIVMNAAKIILAHNHPSGDPTPSSADIKMTRDLIRAGQLLKIDLLDHIIIGNPGHISLRELGYFS